VKLDRVLVEKPWGRSELPTEFGLRTEGRTGEVWFTGGSDDLLLPKYIFTNEKLSIQVHPGGRHCMSPGKTECWYIVDAGSNASIGVGLRYAISREELREVAMDGTIDQLLDWRPVRPGDFFVVTPGTIHAIGGDITLLEIGQKSGATYRLYDYGRPRALHILEAVAAANPVPYLEHLFQHVDKKGDRVLLDWPELAIVYTRSDCLQERARWVLPVNGSIRYGSITAGRGECLFLQPGARIDEVDGDMVIAAGGGSRFMDTCGTSGISGRIARTRSPT
jgi:mannose-6-phosphate isomerase